MNDSNFDQLRDDYAITINTVRDTERMRHMNSFFFWSTWATAANRPGSDITYTNNWPNEQLIDNKPTGEMVVWSTLWAGRGRCRHHPPGRHVQRRPARAAVPRPRGRLR